VSGRDTNEEKALPASAKKLREARKKGQIAHSREMVTAAVTLAAFGYLLARGDTILAAVTDGLLAVPDALDLPFDQAVAAIASRLAADMLWAVTPLVALVAATAVLTNVVVNGGLILALDPVSPKMERLNPVDGFRRIFAMKSLAELIKAIIKLLVIGVLTVLVVEKSLQTLVELPACSLSCAGSVLIGLVDRLLLTLSAFLLILGAFDVGLQRWLFLRDMRMTKTEQKRERKDSDGDPHIKRRHRQERLISGARTGLRNATFVIRSSESAYALRYAAPDALVPVLVARGTEDRALLLVEDARRQGIPVVFDAETASVIATRLKIGDLIKQDMFQAVIACMHEAKVL